mgnify:CR=1 FL=1
MTTDINCSCEIDETGVTVCYPPQNSPGGSGITGVGSVGYLPKILTLVGADGTDIVTVGNSRFYESASAAHFKTASNNITFDFENAQINAKSGQLRFDADTGLLKKLNGTNVLDIENQRLFPVASTGVFTPSRINDGVYGIKIVDLTTNEYSSRDGNIALKMESRELFTTSGSSSIDWDYKILYSNSSGSFNYGSGTFIDSTGALSVSVDELVILGAGQQGTSGQVLTTNGAGVLSWTTVSGGGGTTTNSLTIGTGLSGTSFNGSAPVTIAIDSTVATLTGSQALTNKTYNGLTITSSTGTLTVVNGKTVVLNNSITFSGTDSTTITMPTATSTVLANNLGLSGGTTLIGGTAATDLVEFRKTSGNQVTGVSNIFKFTSGNNGANELVRFGDGIATNIGEFSAWAAGQSSSTTHMWRAGTNFSYFNAGTDLRLQVGAVSYINMLSGAGTVAIQKPLTFASGANVTLVAGSTTLAPLIMTSGTYKTTAAAGSIEYNGQFSMTPTDATRRYVVLAAGSTKTTAGAPYTNDGYVTMNINGTDVKVMTTA